MHIPQEADAFGEVVPMKDFHITKCTKHPFQLYNILNAEYRKKPKNQSMKKKLFSVYFDWSITGLIH